MLTTNRPRFLGLVAVLMLSVGLGLTVAKLSENDHPRAVTLAWPRVSHLRDGRTVSVSRRGVVTERDHRGAVLLMTYFQSPGDYWRWVGFMSSFRAAVTAGNRERVAELFAYPFAWNHDAKNVQIDDRESLLANYAAIFDPRVVAAISHADPRALFATAEGVMLGDGVAWGAANGQQNDYRSPHVLTTINTPAA